MPYNPSFPASHAFITSPAFREQFNSLYAMIQAIPAGPPGPPGPPGSAANVTGAIVDNSDPANAIIRTDVADGAPKLVEGPSDGINRFLGKDVSASSFDQIGGGSAGNAALVDGDDFSAGADPAGEGPGNRFIVDLGAGNEAAIQILTITESWHGGPDVTTDATCDFRYSDDGTNWVIVGSFVLPSGSGVTVALEFTFPHSGVHRYWSFIVTAGGPGSMMLREVQGFCRLPAYVPEARIAPEIARVASMDAGDAAVQAAAAAASSNNTNAVALLGLTVSDPPTQGEIQAIADKLDELISALRR